MKTHQIVKLTVMTVLAIIFIVHLYYGFAFQYTMVKARADFYDGILAFWGLMFGMGLFVALLGWSGK